MGRLVALAAAAGSRSVALHHYVQPGQQSVQLEDAVAAALVAAAEAHGKGSKPAGALVPGCHDMPG